MSIAFPPLLTGVAVPGNPKETAVRAAPEADPGTVFYGLDPNVMEVAILLAPEEPLERAVRVSLAASLGLNDAIGALAPPEVAVHLAWPDRILINGAAAGTLSVVASTKDPGTEPDWLVLALSLDVAPTEAPGDTPELSTLHDEGCAEVTTPDLIEAWGRHMMNWLHIYMTDGFEPLHREWAGKAHAMGETTTYPEAGQIVGMDENGGLILKTEAQTKILPLTQLVDMP